MRREYLRSSAMRGLILGLLCTVTGLAAAAPPPARLKAVALRTPAAGAELALRIEGDYSFRALQAAPDTVFVDLMGVTAGDVAPEGTWTSGALKGYSLFEYTNAAQRPVVHLRLKLNHPAFLRTEKAAGGLRILFEENPQTVPAPPVAKAAEMPAVTPGGPVEVREVSISSGENSETFVDVATQGQARYRVFQLSNPSRLVVDFEGARHASRPKTYAANSALLSGVRVGQFRAKDPSVVRVVADLTGDPIYDVQKTASGVRIALKSHASVSQPAKTPAVTEEDQTETAKAVAPVREEPAAPVQSASKPEVPAAAAATETAAAPSPAETPAVENALPGNSAAVSATPKPGAVVLSTRSQEAAVEAARIMAGSTLEASAAQGQMPAAGASSAPEEPRYSGEPISLNLKNVDLKDFFRLIHEISGLNIIIDPNVAGNVTMVLDNVPWDQALDIVLKNNQLGKTLEGNVLRIARLDTLTAEQASTAKLAAARDEAQPLVTKFVPVNYAKASSIATMLKSWVGGGALSKRGNILVDDRTNTLIVSDIASQIPIILPIITKLDTKTKQVAIEARIERVTRDFSRNLSNALSVGYVNKAGNTVQTGLVGTGSQATTSLTTAPVTTVTDTVGSGFGVYAISNIGARYIINDVLAAAETKSDAKTISKPTIVTQNNVPGTVLQGVQIPIQTTINNTISIQYIQASLQLTVTPQVTSDGNIFLVINVQNSSPGPALTGAGPSINTQSATTQVLVPDGGTVIFGGVTVNSATNSATYVPLLGKIPILGNLFKSTIKTTADQELLFFVSPKILPG